jgi:hypothetical protein
MAFAVMGSPIKADFVDVEATKFTAFAAVGDERSARREFKTFTHKIVNGEVVVEAGVPTPLTVSYRGDGYRATEAIVTAGTAMTAHRDGTLRSRQVGEMVVIFLGKMMEDGKLVDDPVLAVRRRQANKICLGHDIPLVTNKPTEYGELKTGQRVLTVNEDVQVLVVDRGSRGLPIRPASSPVSSDIWTWRPEIIAAAINQMTEIVKFATGMPANDTRSPRLVQMVTEEATHFLTSLEKDGFAKEEADGIATAISEQAKPVGDYWAVPFETVPAKYRGIGKVMWDLSHMRDKWANDNAIVMSPLVYPSPEDSRIVYDTMDFYVPKKYVKRPVKEENLLKWLLP